MYKLNTPQFKIVKRSVHGKGTDFKQDIVEYIGNKGYIPTSINCSIKCNIYFIIKVYTEEFLTFFRTEQRRSNVMTSARIQSFCRKHKIKIGYFSGKEVWPRNITERKIAFKIHKNQFSLNWKWNDISFNKTIEELKINFKIVDSVIADKHVESFNKYEYKPKRVQSQLTNIVVYDIETFDTIGCVPYSNCIYRLIKISGKYNRDRSEREYQNVEKIALF